MLRISKVPPESYFICFWLLYLYLRASTPGQEAETEADSDSVLFLICPGLPRWLSGKESACQWRVRSQGQDNPLEKKMTTHSSIPAWRIPMDRGAWWVTVHRVAKSWTWLSTPSYYTFREANVCFHRGDSVTILALVRGPWHKCACVCVHAHAGAHVPTRRRGNRNQSLRTTWRWT